MSLGGVVALAVERVVRPVEGMHRAISRRWFDSLGVIGKLPRFAHDTIAGTVYRSIRVGAVAIGAGLDTRRRADSPSSAAAQAVVNGLWGDALGRHELRLEMPMGIRNSLGDPIAPHSDLTAAFPGATGRLVVLVHGLVKTERCWHGTDTKPGLIHSIDAHPALTALAIRYNSGLSVATNGERLAVLLEEVHSRWPAAVESIALVGHSMGGLVIRSASAAAQRAGHQWIGNATDVVTLGSPHRGAPLEKLAHLAAQGLSVAPQTRPLADFIETRSQGIKDLRHGAVEHLQGNPDPELAGIKHHFVAGVVTSNPAHPFGAVVGDLMVRTASSTSAPCLDPTNVVVLGGVHHFDLLHDAGVIDRVMEWLTPLR